MTTWCNKHFTHTQSPGDTGKDVSFISATLVKMLVSLPCNTASISPPFPVSTLVAARSKSLRLWLPSLLRRGSEARDAEDLMLTPPDAEALALDTFDPRLHLLQLRRRSSLAEVDHCPPPPPPQPYAGDTPNMPPDSLWRTSSSFKEKGTLSAGDYPTVLSIYISIVSRTEWLNVSELLM